METRTAPQWIRDREAGYRRTRRMWTCAMVLGWLCCLVFLISIFLPRNTLWDVVRYVSCSAYVAWVFLRIERRVQRYGNAAKALNAAIAQYEGGPDLGESILGEADRRARETLHVERIRTAPAGIRSKRRRCTLRILGWFTVPLAGALLMAALFWWPLWYRGPWVFPLLLAVFVGSLVGAMFGTRKLKKVWDILGEAIERYECESAATQSDLDEAGQRASEILSGKSERGEPAP
jgi:FtsH-binding integral membrane protein